MRKFANIWVGFTLFLYYFGPYSWDGAQQPWVAIFVIAAMIGFNIGYLSISPREQYRYYTIIPSFLFQGKAFSLIVLILIIGLTAYNINVTTGLSFLSPSSWSLDFGEVYAEYQKNVRQISMSQTELLFLVMKAVVFPISLLIFCNAFPKNKLLCALFAFPLIASSFMRGTDKETFDVFIILIVAAFYNGFGRKIMLYASILTPVVIFLFIERKAGRFGDVMPTCHQYVCFNYNSLAASISPKLEFGMVMLSQYITNGYEGLNFSFGVPFEFHYGLGHLFPIERVFCTVTGLLCDISSYNDRAFDAGWDTRYRWTSVYPWLANDFHFIFIPIYMIFIGRITRVAENFWWRERSPVALATLIMLAIFFAYSSANMQVAISLEWATAWIVFVYIPVFTLRARRQASVPLLAGGQRSLRNLASPFAPNPTPRGVASIGAHGERAQRAR